MAAPDTLWHALEPTEVARRFETDAEAGLAPAEAVARLRRHGPNALIDVGRQRWWHILGRQFLSALILILVIGATLSAAIGHTGDALTIIAIVILNAGLGFFQEWRAE
jgi:P-type Ca2+ transporter type 2C